MRRFFSFLSLNEWAIGEILTLTLTFSGSRNTQQLYGISASLFLITISLS